MLAPLPHCVNSLRSSSSNSHVVSHPATRAHWRDVDALASDESARAEADGKMPKQVPATMKATATGHA